MKKETKKKKAGQETPTAATGEQIVKFTYDAPKVTAQDMGIPGVIRKPFPLKTDKGTETRFSYHIKFQRGSRDEFIVDLVMAKEFQGGKAKTDASAYRTLDDIFEGQTYIEAFPVYIDGQGVEVAYDNKNARLAVKVHGSYRVMGRETKVSSILDPQTKEHRRALEEFFKAKNAILKEAAEKVNQAQLFSNVKEVEPTKQDLEAIARIESEEDGVDELPFDVN